MGNFLNITWGYPSEKHVFLPCSETHSGSRIRGVLQILSLLFTMPVVPQKRWDPFCISLNSDDTSSYQWAASVSLLPRVSDVSWRSQWSLVTNHPNYSFSPFISNITHFPFWTDCPIITSGPWWSNPSLHTLFTLVSTYTYYVEQSIFQRIKVYSNHFPHSYSILKRHRCRHIIMLCYILYTSHEGCHC